MAEAHPLIRTIDAAVPAVGTAGNDATTIIGEAPFAGTVTAVTYTPASDITGAATNNRTFSLVNKGTDGNGTTVVASLNMANAVNASDFDERTITLSVVAGATTVAEGDILAWTSVHIGTGITDPGGRVEVTISRS